MNNQINTFNLILEKYRFITEIPDDIKTGIYAKRKNSLRKTLKLLDDYSFSFGLVLFVLFLFQKAGVKLSLFSCKIILACSVIAATGVSSAGVYKVYKIIERSDRSAVAPISANDQLNLIMPSDQLKSRPAVQPATLGIAEIEFSGIDASAAQNISEKMYASIVRTRKDIVLLKKNNNDGKKIPYRLIGRMFKIGKNTVLTVKVVDAQSSTIQFSETINFKEDENIDAKLDELSGKIAHLPSLWDKN
jgi:hypothetical protein